MKNLLIATTALVATASVAAADGHAGVSVSGDARMGIVNDGDDTAFNSRVRISFSGAGETDSGLTFGGSIRADNSGGGASGTGGSVYLGGESWKLSMGDVDGGMKAAVGHLAGVGYTGLGDTNEFTFLGGNHDTSALLQASFAGATVYLSSSQLTDGAFGDDTTIFAGQADVSGLAVNDILSLGVAYELNDYNFGLGYETAEIGGADVKHYGLSAAGTFSGVTVKAAYLAGDVDGTDFTQMGLSADAKINTVGVTAFYKVTDVDGAADSVANYGLGVSYDLGGGAVVKAGYVDTDVDGVDGAFDLGINFSF